LIAMAATAGLSALILGQSISLPLLIAPMGASAVLLFALPASPLSQPWSLIGGNLVSAIVGVACAAWLGDTPDAAAAVAVALAIGCMFLLRCLHPPSGAVALTAVLGGPAVHALGYGFALAPVGLNSLVLVAVAATYHRLTGHRYPHAVAATRARAAPQARDGLGFTRADLDAVLESREELLDIDVDDLETLLRAAEMRAYGRRFGAITAQQIMSRTVQSVSPATTAEAAWAMLLEHRIKALPVIEANGRLVGIVTQSDFVRHARLDTFAALRQRGLFALGGRGVKAGATVAEIMSSTVKSVNLTQAIADLVPAFTDYGHHHLPVIDEEQRLCGMVTQADLVAGLYRARHEEARYGT
jgi:CBS domain-containing membrane protein